MRKDKAIKEREQDYYLENGMMVFTASYLLKRGYCCQRGCRHCPYSDEQKKTKKKKRE